MCVHRCHQYALTSTTASIQFHSCGEEDILIGSFFAVSPQTSQLGAQNIAVGGEGQGGQEVGSITGPSVVCTDQMVAVGSLTEQVSLHWRKKKYSLVKLIPSCLKA